MKSARTRSIAIAAPPGAVMDLVGDGGRIPEWAPGFAPKVHADGDLWVIDSDGGIDDAAVLKLQRRVRDVASGLHIRFRGANLGVREKQIEAARMKGLQRVFE